MLTCSIWATHINRSICDLCKSNKGISLAFNQCIVPGLNESLLMEEWRYSDSKLDPWQNESYIHVVPWLYDPPSKSIVHGKNEALKMMVPKTNLDTPITRDYFVRDGRDRMLKKKSLGMIRTKFFLFCLCVGKNNTGCIWTWSVVFHYKVLFNSPHHNQNSLKYQVVTRWLTDGLEDNSKIFVVSSWFPGIVG